MWPWEHAAFGYLLLSLGSRATGREPPSAVATGLLLVGSQVPDLVDKPLSWELGLFPSGYAIGHSALVALPVGLVLLAAAHRTERVGIGVGFVAGYWSHLVADVLDPLRYGDDPIVGRVLWPVVEGRPYEHDLGLRRGLVYLERFVRELASMEPGSILLVYLALPFVTVLLWVFDGSPGLAAVVHAVRPGE